MATAAHGAASHAELMKPAAKTRPRRWFRRLLGVLLVLGVLAAAVVIYANATAIWAGNGRLFDDVAAVPKMKVGLVFGTGNGNPYFNYRIDAAVRVWQAGKLETLIVSGDNRSRYYNEPEKMKQDLVARGIPENRIVCDYAGLRTFDSVVRAKEIFGATSILVISQRFQNERAIYIAEANGMEAYGFNARDVEAQAGLKTRIREVGARVLMWLDVNFLNTRPVHLGKKVALPK